jgi:hypothetical protein
MLIMMKFYDHQSTKQNGIFMLDAIQDLTFYTCLLISKPISNISRCHTKSERESLMKSLEEET